MNARKKRTIIMCSLIIFVFIIGIAYSTLASRLEVFGTTTVNSAGTWNIYFNNLSDPIVSGNVEVSKTKLTSTMFEFEASLATPGDSISFTFDVVNGGILDAKLTAVTLIGKELLEENNLVYNLVYVDDKGNEIELKTNEDKLLNKNTKNNKKKLKLTVSYDINASTAHWETVELGMGVIMIYSQDNSNNN